MSTTKALVSIYGTVFVLLLVLAVISAEETVEVDSFVPTTITEATHRTILEERTTTTVEATTTTTEAETTTTVELVGNPEVYERLASETDCSELQESFDRSFTNHERAANATEDHGVYTNEFEMAFTLGYMEAADARMREIGCYTVAVYYANCDEMREASVAPIREGEPGYRSGLDRDSDGVACE